MPFIAPFGELAGRFELPKPCGARPESVVRPCALHERLEFAVAPDRAPGCVAYGGRLEESSDWRLALKPLDVFDIECAIAVVPPRAIEPLFIVRDGECDAAAAGVVRAITLRFATLEEGVATCLPIFAAPSELARAGEA